MEFHEKLQKLIESSGDSDAKIGRAAGFSHTSIANWASGATEPTVKKAARLARYFGVSLDYLTDDAQDQPPRQVSADEQALLDVMRARGITPAMVLQLLIPNKGVELLNEPARDSETKHRRA